MKTEIDRLDATPSKRLFLSIIADYDLNRSICELVDNGLDVWVRSGKVSKIIIQIVLNKEQQSISVEDNAGGLPKEELRFVVGPGQTGSIPSDETIGIFGVGTKRAVVALAQDIKISTRHKSGKTYQVDFDDTWLADDDWHLPYYEVDEIAKGTTLVELQKLRLGLTDDAEKHLRDHLGATYAKFLDNKGVTITLNGSPIKPRFFDNWSYPPNYSPRRYSGKLSVVDGKKVTVALQLHKRLFGEVWSWGGKLRQTERNIGIDPLHIAVQLRACVDDARFWFEHESYSPMEAALRFHHRLTVIHPFPNGNGRHARIMADALLQKVYSVAPIDWAGGENLQNNSERRTKYINALRAADRGEFALLFGFAGVNQ